MSPQLARRAAPPNSIPVRWTGESETEDSDRASEKSGTFTSGTVTSGTVEAGGRALAHLSVAPESGDDPFTAALILGWLPTLPRRAKERFFESLDEDRDIDGLELRAVRALARWRVARDRRQLRDSAVRLLTASFERGPGSSRDVARSALLLHPVLLAARLGGLRLESTERLAAGRWRRFRPRDLVIENLRLLADFLLEADLGRATDAVPSPAWILCLGTELWRETTPWSAPLRTPLEVAVWQRWHRLPAEPTANAASLAALIVAAENLHVDVDLAAMRRRLAALQESDGGFPAKSPALDPRDAYRHPASRTLTTVLAARALLGQPRTGGRWIP